MLRERFNICYEFDREEVVRRIDSTLSEGGAGFVAVADGNVLQRVHRDPEYRATVRGAMFSICDSGWVPVFLKRIHGEDVEQYCGSRIFDDLTRAGRYRQMFLGTSEETLSALKANLVGIDPKIAGMTFLPLPFRAVEEFDYESIAQIVNDDRPDIIWVALGAPKQEMFMERLKPWLDRGVMIGVGAVFNFRSGTGERRAPAWMVRARLEWLYRIFASPRKQIARCWRIITAYPAIIREEIRRRDCTE